jgi:hypothetical protein
LDQQRQAHNRAIQVVNDETGPGVERTKTQPAGKTSANGASVATANQPAGQNKVGSNSTARNANVPAPAPSSPRITGATGVMAPALRPADPAEIQEEVKQALKEIEGQQTASEAKANNVGLSNCAKKQDPSFTVYAFFFLQAPSLMSLCHSGLSLVDSNLPIPELTGEPFWREIKLQSLLVCRVDRVRKAMPFTPQIR